jgi:hypothetical protein
MARFHSGVLFLEAAGKYGVASMTFALGFLGIGVYEHSIEKNVSGYVYFTVAVLLIVWGCYLAWNEEHKKLQAELARNTQPDVRAEIDCVIRNVRDGGGFFIHFHIVNLSEAATSLRNVLLHNHSTGERLPAYAFSKVSLVRQGVKHISVTQTEQGISKTETQVLDEVPDSLHTIRSTTFLKGVGLDGWLLFRKPYDLQETETPALSLDVEDAFGKQHKGLIAKLTYECGAFL